MQNSLKSENKIRRLTVNQASALSTVITGLSLGGSVSSSYISTATGLTGRALGGTVSALERNDFIQPFGKDGRLFNWELVDPDIKDDMNKDPQGLINIINRVANRK